MSRKPPKLPPGVTPIGRARKSPPPPAPPAAPVSVEPPPGPPPAVELAFLQNREACLLVAAWALVHRHRKERAFLRLWARQAGVRDDAARIHGERLLASGLLLKDGTVAEDARALVLAMSLAGLPVRGKR